MPNCQRFFLFYKFPLPSDVLLPPRATTLRTAALALVHSTAEYCAPVWSHSAHTRLIDPAINDALRIVIVCLCPTPADNLPILAGIQPAELRRSGATLSLARRAMEPGHLLHSALTRPSCALPWSLDICSTQRSPVHRVQMHGASNRDTHLHSPHNNSSVHLTTTTYVRRIGRITNGMRCRGTTPQDSAFSSPTPTPIPPERPSQEEAGSDLTASAQALGVSAHVCTNGVSPPLWPVSVAQKNKLSTVLSFDVQSIDLTVDCMAWRFWIMRQSNGCSTPAPRPNAAKQWLEQLAQKKKFQITQYANNIRIFIQVKVNIPSAWIITKLIRKTWSFCEPLEIAWPAKCGTRAVGCRPLPAKGPFFRAHTKLHDILKALSSWNATTILTVRLIILSSKGLWRTYRKEHIAVSCDCGFIFSLLINELFKQIAFHLKQRRSHFADVLAPTYKIQIIRERFSETKLPCLVPQESAYKVCRLFLVWLEKNFNKTSKKFNTEEKPRSWACVAPRSFYS